MHKFSRITVKRAGSLFLLFALSACLTLRGADALRLPNGAVVAFVGGEDIVAMQQYGYVELLLARPAHGQDIRFRNLGREGDTVFEQKRDLNFPSWEQALTKIGATVVIAQFGQAESLRGAETLPQFRVAAEKLFKTLAGTNRQLVLLSPTPFEKTSSPLPDIAGRNADLSACTDALRELAHRHAWRFADVFRSPGNRSSLTRDGLHLNAAGHWRLALELSRSFGVSDANRSLRQDARTGRLAPSAAEQLRQAIIAKNRLWFDYWRPQNWAFLHGDRTEQPSSRDHRDPKVRWFPEEIEKFLPLIEAKEREAAELAKKLP